MATTTQATTYTTTITRTTEAAVAAFVEHDGARYGVTLTRGLCTCSCPHAMWRGVEACKHLQKVADQLRAQLADLIVADERDDAAIELVRAAWSRAQAWSVFAEERDRRAAAARQAAA